MYVCRERERGRERDYILCVAFILACLGAGSKLQVPGRSRKRYRKQPVNEHVYEEYVIWGFGYKFTNSN